MTDSDGTPGIEPDVALRESNEKLRYALLAARMGVWEWDLLHDKVTWSPETERIFGLEPGTFGGNYEAYAAFITPSTLARVNQQVEEFVEAACDTAEIHYQHPICRPDGQEAWVEVRGTIAKDAAGRPFRMAGICADITDRVRRERETEELEIKLQHAQKLEAIGQLAGGVAHDFNNILTAILGHVELLLDTQDSAKVEAPADSLVQIRSSAERAANLTRQLLAFSRQQVAQLQALALDDTLDGLEPILRRLLPENISVDRVRDEGLPLVLADPTQLEQIVMNLAINARDAMPEGGRLTIETSTAHLDESYTASRPEVVPGAYVLLRVSDTGAGMDELTIDRIYEPFFTTKKNEDGTGLGLATVYGIVKQSKGHIAVYSEIDRGTTFRVYFPVHAGEITEPSTPEALVGSLVGDETILVAEDDPAVRELTSNMLTSVGYEVLSAANGAEAMRHVEKLDGPLHLLVTDVVMPDMNGRELAEAVVKVRGDVRVLYISGYTANVIAHQGVLDSGIEFLEKPFTRRALLERVRLLLGVRRD